MGRPKAQTPLVLRLNSSGAGDAFHPHCGSLPISSFDPAPESPVNAAKFDFELLLLLETEPNLTQRQIAERLGVSLGRVNYCLKALRDQGAVRMERFRRSGTKPDYAYVLTPQGISHRVAMTGRFLKRKLAEYERLKSQIETLSKETGREIEP